MSEGNWPVSPARWDAPFLITKEYRRFAEFCDACRRYRYIGLSYGPPGAGTRRRRVQTLSARQYTHWDRLEAVLYARWTLRGRALEPEFAAYRSLISTPSVTNTPRAVATHLASLREALSAVIRDLSPEEADDAAEERRLTAEYTELLLIDEADRLKMAALEQVRDSYDRKGFDVVLIGMPGLEKRLARYPQLYSRVGFVHQFRPLSGEELRFILEHDWRLLGLTLTPEDFADAEAMAAIARITGGNFRVLQRLFTQVERILQINELRTITKEVVEAARDSLVIGAT